jgi:hypothetical protein
MTFLPNHSGGLRHQRSGLSLLLITLLIWNCGREPDPPSEAQQHLQAIALQHFQDMPVSKSLLPIADYDRWVGTRMQVQHDGRGHVFTVPPPPPADTILYDSDFPVMARQAHLTRGDIRAFRSQLSGTGQPQQLQPQPGLQRIDPATDPDRAHYCLSVPLFNADYSRALLSVHHCIPGAFQGFRYVLERRDTSWEVVYSRLYVIE